MSGDSEPTREELVRELGELRAKLAQAEAAHETRRRIAASLEESEARFQAVLDHLGAVVWEADAATLQTLFMSKQISRMLGATWDECLARVNDPANPLYPDGVESIAAKVRHVAETGESAEFDYRMQTAEGRIIWVRDRVSMAEDREGRKRLRGVMLDITARKEAKEAAGASSMRVKDILESIADAFFSLDNEMRFIFFNTAAERLLGRKADEVVGKKLIEAFPEAKGSVFERKYLEALHDRKALTFETYFDVHPYMNWYEVRVYPHDDGISVYFQVTTERHKAEEERRKLEAQMQHAQKLESLGVLAGGIAHDFNNLLMAVLGNADLALQDISDVSPARPMLEEIARVSRRAADLCKQMLAYSGKGKFVVRVVNLSELVEEMAHMLEVTISKKAILKYSFTPDLPSIEADVTQLRQVIMNLITNASEAIGERSGIIAISTGVMQCDREYLRGTHIDEELPEGRYVYLEVADNGCGMEPLTLQRIFDPFFTTKFTGRGLGLAAVLGIVRGHHGAIKAYSEKGKGSSFKILFPAKDGAASAAADADETGVHWRSAGTVLLVDDEATLRTLCRRMLERLGFSVVTAGDGREAIELFRNQANGFDCVILDLTMPHMDGEETFRELRRIQADVPVVMSSGYNEQEVTQRFVGRGLAGFIQKPYQLNTLSNVLRHVLERRNPGGAAT